MTRILVCGSRDFVHRKWLFDTLDKLHTERYIVSVVHGGANGADALAGEWAAERDAAEIIFRADWRQHGRAAGPIRNQTMLDEGKPDLVVAFPGGRGTADMVRRAKAASVEVIEVG